MATLPPWTGFNFVPTLHNQVPESLNPGRQTLPSTFVVCITGASRGIGAQTARAFAQAGATGLVLTARTVDALQTTKETCLSEAKAGNLKISTLAADASSEEAARAIASIVKAEHGRLDVLINNAGLVSTDPSAFSELHDIGSDQVQNMMNVNYVGKFLTIKYLLPILLESSDSARTIINVTSFSSHFASMGAMGFNISELAVNRLTEAVAETYSSQGVLCHSVHPGMVRTTPPPGMPESMLSFCSDSTDLCGAFLLWLVKERRTWLSGRYVSSNWDVEELQARSEEIVKQDKLKMRLAV